MVIDNRLGRAPSKRFLVVGEIRPKKKPYEPILKDISVVFGIWFSFVTGQCLYPNYSTLTKCLEATYTCEEPKKNWRVFTVHTIYAETDTYVEATNILNSLLKEEESSVDSDSPYMSSSARNPSICTSNVTSKRKCSNKPSHEMKTKERKKSKSSTNKSNRVTAKTGRTNKDTEKKTTPVPSVSSSGDEFDNYCNDEREDDLSWVNDVDKYFEEEGEFQLPSSQEPRNSSLPEKINPVPSLSAPTNNILLNLDNDLPSSPINNSRNNFSSALQNDDLVENNNLSMSSTDHLIPSWFPALEKILKKHSEKMFTYFDQKLDQVISDLPKARPEGAQLGLPVNNQIQMIQYEKRLEDESFKKNFTKFLQGCVQNEADMKEAVNICLSAVFSNKIVSQYNLTGQHGKFAIDKTMLWTVIKDIVMEECDTASEKKIRKRASKWLKYRNDMATKKQKNSTHNNQPLAFDASINNGQPLASHAPSHNEALLYDPGMLAPDINPLQPIIPSGTAEPGIIQQSVMVLNDNDYSTNNTS